MSSAPAVNPVSTERRVNLLDYDPAALARFFEELGEKPFRATQVLKWVHQRFVTDFDQMTDLSKNLRAKLEAETEIRWPKATFDQLSSDGTRKWLLSLDGGNAVETVFIPETSRGTLCVSSQVGCVLDCKFCSTAQQGFNRNLSVAEIIGQVLFAKQALAGTGQDVTNVVFMGMGEPLLNFDKVMAASRLMTEDNCYGLSKRRVTLSTSGVVPYLHKMREVTDISLAVSLHAPNDTLREQIVPINKNYPIAELLDACRAYIAGKPHRRITWEYVMLDGVNDHDQHARELAKLLKDIPSKVNLIPFNPFPGTAYRCSPAERIRRFQRILQESDLVTTIRKTRGQDIDGACGQLVGKVEDRMRRKARQATQQGQQA